MKGCIIAAVALLTIRAAAGIEADAGSTLAEPVPPRVELHDQRYLTQIVRRTLAAAAAKKPNYQPTYRPAALESVHCQIIVTLREAGAIRARGVSHNLPVLDAAMEAARVALKDAPPGWPDAEALGRTIIEMEAAGEPVPASLPPGWAGGQADPHPLETLIEPGAYGVELEHEGEQRRFCPSEIFTTDHKVYDALVALGEQLGLAGDKVDQAKLSRFRTVHWVEVVPDGKTVQLHRGMVLITPGLVTAQAVDTAIQRLAEYMLYRQRPDGTFSYQYEPARDVWSDEDNAVRQAGAAWAMAHHARMSRSDAALSAADLSVKQHLSRLTDLAGVENAAFIRTADDENELGVTALVCLALLDHPQPERFAAERQKLLGGLLWPQEGSGRFVTAFPPARTLSTQVHFPGEALCALARAYRDDPQDRSMRAFDLAIGYYRDYFERQRVPAFAPWQIQAFAEMAVHSKRHDFAEFVFRMSDWLADAQLGDHNCRWPELWGGFAPSAPGRAGISTAAFVEGLVEALRLARQRDDRERAVRYERAIAAAIRFVLQLQVRPEETYFMRSPRDAIGGIRTAPSLSHLRIDHCQHALMGLWKAREVLFQ